MSHTFDRRSLLKELRERGVRITEQRRVLIEIIQAADRHLDAQTLLELGRRRDPGIDRATVYRTLSLLKKLRLVDELDLMRLQGDRHFYEVTTRREHIHLACLQCGAIVEFASPLFERLKAEMVKRSGFSLRMARLEAGGICAQCAVAPAAVAAKSNP